MKENIKTNKVFFLKKRNEIIHQTNKTTIFSNLKKKVDI